MKLKHAAIVLNNVSDRCSLPASSLTSFDLLIATDGGCRRLPSGVTPTIVCGDFDSISSEEAGKLFPTAKIAIVSDQEASDLDKAVAIAKQRGAERITLIDAIEGRIDHSMSAVSALLRHHSTVEICILQGRERLAVHSPRSFRGPELTLSVALSDTVSLAPLSEDAVITTRGLQWPLTNEHLAAGTRGVSNRATSESVAITVHRGLVCVTHIGR